MMKKKQSIIALVLAAIVTVLLGWTMIKGWGPTGTGSMKNINLGLDLSGGVSITYQAVKDNRQTKKCQIPATSWNSVRSSTAKRHRYICRATTVSPLKSRCNRCNHHSGRDG